MSRVLIGIILILIGLFGIWFFFLRNNSVGKVTKQGPIIFFGNSITAGIGASEGNDFPSLIAKELNLTSIINAGIAGDTTATALTRLQTDVLAKNPSLVVVELSGNDFLQQTPADQTIKNLDSIVRRIHETGAAVILIHINFPRNSATYKEGFENIAKKYKAQVLLNSLEGITGNQTLMADELHPNSAGYKILAKRIAKVIKEII